MWVLFSWIIFERVSFVFIVVGKVVESLTSDFSSHSFILYNLTCMTDKEIRWHCKEECYHNVQ